MTAAERKAVLFFAALAAAGAGARALGIGDPPGARPPTPADRLALQHQLEAVDSAHAHRERGRAGRGKARGRGRRSRSDVADTTAALAAAPPAEPRTAPTGAGRKSHREPRREPPRESLVVDVNTADTLALQALPGVGPALARRIVADRAARGAYASVAELSRVRGIGAGLERRLGPRVTFTPGGRPSAGPAGVTRVPPVRWPAP